MKLLNTFDKRNLKTGMLVRTRDGVLRLMLGDTAISLDGNSGGGLGMHRIDDELKCLGSTANDIMEIYDEPRNSGHESSLAAGMEFWMKENNLLRYTILIWKRKA